jgi:hypothetical protein
VRHACFVAFLYLALGYQSTGQAPSHETRVTLERTSCFGMCPVYRLEIRGDGTVTFEGKMFVRVTGTQQAAIEPRAVQMLAREFTKIDYFALDDKYATIKNPDGTESFVTDLPTITTSITLGSKYKRVVDYVGAPRKLRELEHRIDEVAGSKRWVSIDAVTVHEKCRQGWDINGKEARQLLTDASRVGDAEVVSAFIAEGATTKVQVGEISLLQIARGAEVVRLLISAGADVNSPAVNQTGPPIVQAAEYGDTDSIRALIDAGARVNGKSADGVTALMMAAQSGIPASVRLLLSAGAEAGAKDSYGEAALDYMRHAEQSCIEEQRHPSPFSDPKSDCQTRYTQIRELLTPVGKP